MVQYMTTAEKRERLNRLSEEEYMRWAYVPFCIAAGAWDYADTVINLSALMRIDATKKLCQTIRELKRSYDGHRRRHAMTSSGYELHNFQVIEKVSAKSFEYLYACIKDSVRKQYPDLGKDCEQLLLAVYSCMALLNVLYKYMAIQEENVRKVCGFFEMSSILPDELAKLRRLMPEFAGDKPVKIKGLGLFTHNIVNKLCKTQLTKNKEDADLV